MRYKSGSDKNGRPGTKMTSWPPQAMEDSGGVGRASKIINSAARASKMSYQQFAGNAPQCATIN